MVTVIGLGNPGTEYKGTRHNAGYSVLCKLEAFFQTELKKRPFCNFSMAETGKARLVFPLTYMNESGRVIPKLKIFNSKDLVVICDNMDLSVGLIRIKKGGKSAGQKGLQSIINAFGTEDFLRVYIGIGRPEPGIDVTEHVLGRERDPEKCKAYEDALERAAKAVIKYIDGVSLEELQGEFNRK